MPGPPCRKTSVILAPCTYGCSSDSQGAGAYDMFTRHAGPATLDEQICTGLKSLGPSWSGGFWEWSDFFWWGGALGLLHSAQDMHLSKSWRGLARKHCKKQNPAFWLWCAWNTNTRDGPVGAWWTQWKLKGLRNTWLLKLLVCQVRCRDLLRRLGELCIHHGSEVFGRWKLQNRNKNRQKWLTLVKASDWRNARWWLGSCRRPGCFASPAA